MSKAMIFLALASISTTGCELVEPPTTGESNTNLVAVTPPRPQVSSFEVRSRAPAPITVAELDSVAEGLNRFGLALLAAQCSVDSQPHNLAFSNLALQTALARIQQSAAGGTACELGTQLRMGLAQERMLPALERLARVQEIKPASIGERATLQTGSATLNHAWREAFDPRASRPGVFRGLHASRDVLMMHATRRLPYLDHEAFQLLVLPLRSEERPRSLVLLLPRSNDGLAHVEALLEERRLCRWMAKAEERSIALALPRLTLRSTLSMRAALEEVGIRRVFSRADELPALGHALSDVEHVAGLSLHEAGIGALPTPQAPLSSPRAAVGTGTALSFQADHAFLLLLRDDETGALLFFARVVSP